MSRKKSVSDPAVEAVTDEEPPKRKRGRPKTSPHDLATQRKINLQRYRQTRKEENEVRVDIYLPREWHDWLVNVDGANLREAALEAFAALLDKKGFPGRQALK